MFKSATNKSDLTECDREPIRIPNCVQSHGFLLVLKEPDLNIVQVSDNIEQLSDTSS